MVFMGWVLDWLEGLFGGEKPHLPPKQVHIKQPLRQKAAMEGQAFLSRRNH
jgi:hypothetical protein